MDEYSRLIKEIQRIKGLFLLDVCNRYDDSPYDQVQEILEELSREAHQLIHGGGDNE